MRLIHSIQPGLIAAMAMRHLARQCRYFMADGAAEDMSITDIIGTTKLQTTWALNRPLSRVNWKSYRAL